MSNALILVDLQNDFMPGGRLAVPNGDLVVPIANRLQPFFHLVVATQDWHPAIHGSFASQHPGRKPGDVVQLAGLSQVLWPDHCVQQSGGAAFHSGLNTRSIARVFHKGMDRNRDSYSGFFDNGGEHETGSGSYLRECGITDTFILGLATDYCVRSTALDSARLGFRTWLIEDACRGVELRTGDCAGAVAEMKAAGVTCVTSDRWLAEGRDSIQDATRERLCGGRFINVMRTGRWEYAQRTNARAVIVIVPITEKKEVIFIEQFREPTGVRCVELPAGLVGDDPDASNEELSEAVRRELLEETGYSAERVTFLAEASSSAGLTNESAHVFVAEGLREVNAGGGVDGELIQKHRVPIESVDTWLDARRAEGLDVAMSLYGSLFMAKRLALFEVGRWLNGRFRSGFKIAKGLTPFWRSGALWFIGDRVRSLWCGTRLIIQEGIDASVFRVGLWERVRERPFGTRYWKVSRLDRVVRRHGDALR